MAEVPPGKRGLSDLRKAVFLQGEEQFPGPVGFPEKPGQLIKNRLPLGVFPGPEGLQDPKIELPDPGQDRVRGIGEIMHDQGPPHPEQIFTMADQSFEVGIFGQIGRGNAVENQIRTDLLGPARDEFQPAQSQGLGLFSGHP